MKKIVHSLIIMLVLLSVTECYSQYFLPKEGLIIAQNKTGFSNPELLAVAATNDSVKGISSKLAFYIGTGVANVWFYLFRSADNQNEKKMIICMSIINIVAFEIPVSSLIDSLPYEPAGSLNDIDWINSDVMAEKIRNSQNYLDYKSAHSDAKVSMVTLSYNSDYPYLPIDNAYWLAKINASNSTSLICAVNAVTSDVTCFDEPAAVDEIEGESNSLRIYPNPANTHLFIVVPKDLPIIGSKIEICDENANLVYCFDLKTVPGINVISLPVQVLSNGHYFIKLAATKSILSGKFVIER